LAQLKEEAATAHAAGPSNATTELSTETGATAGESEGTGAGSATKGGSIENPAKTSPQADKQPKITSRASDTPGATSKSSPERHSELAKADRAGREGNLASGASKIGTPVGTANYIRKHRRQLGIGGIILVMGIAVAIALGLLAPLKLESMIKNFIERRVTTRIDHYVERRAERMVINYFNSSVGVGQAGADDVAFENQIVAYGQPLRDLYRTWRVHRFEAQLEADQGLKLTRTGGGINVFKNGELVGNLQGQNALDFIDVAIKDQTRWYQIILRHHLRQWVRVAANVTDWTEYAGTEGEDAAKKEVRTKLVEDANINSTAEFTGLESCIDDGPCKDDEAKSTMEGGDKPLPPDQAAKSQTDNTGDGTIENTVNTASNDAATSAEQQLTKDTKVKLVDRLVIKIFGETLGPKIATMLNGVGLALLVVQAVDYASRIDHLLWPGTLDKVLVQYHKLQYEAQAAQWATRADQIKEATAGRPFVPAPSGKPANAPAGGLVPSTAGGAPLSADEVNATMEYLDHTENAASMQQVINGTHGGQSLYTLNDSAKPNDAVSARSIDETKFPIRDLYRSTIGSENTGGGGIPNPFCTDPGPGTVHCELVLWYNTGHKSYALLNSIIGTILKPIDWLIQQIPGVAWVIQHIADLLTRLFLYIAKVAVDGSEVGADLANGIDAGFTVMGIDVSRDWGGYQVGPVVQEQVDATIAADQAKADQKVSLWNRFFSTDYTHSYVNNLALATPISLQGGLTDGTGYVASFATAPFRTMGPVLGLLGFGRANADALSEASYNVTNYGFSEGDLASPVDQNVLDQAQANADKRLAEPPGKHAKFGEMILEDCPAVPDPDHQPNMCRLNLVTIQNLGSRSTGDDDGGINSPGGM
jgi:hypothetical protein